MILHNRFILVSNYNICFDYFKYVLFLFAANTIEANAKPAIEYPKLAVSPVLILLLSPAFTTLFDTLELTDSLGLTVLSGVLGFTGVSVAVLATNPSIALLNAALAASTSFAVAFSFANVAFASSNAFAITAHVVI